MGHDYDENFEGYEWIEAGLEVAPFFAGDIYHFLEQLFPILAIPGEYGVVLNRLGGDNHHWTAGGHFDVFFPDKIRFTRYKCNDLDRLIEFFDANGVEIFDRYRPHDPFEDCWVEFSPWKISFFRHSDGKTHLIRPNELLDAMGTLAVGQVWELIDKPDPHLHPGVEMTFFVKVTQIRGNDVTYHNQHVACDKEPLLTMPWRDFIKIYKYSRG